MSRPHPVPAQRLSPRRSIAPLVALLAALNAAVALPAHADDSSARAQAAPAVTSPAAVDRPSIMQAEDQRHQGAPFQDVALQAPSSSGGSKPRGGASPAGATGVFNGGGLTREVFGFATYWQLSGGGLSDTQFDKVSTIAYFGLTYDGSGNFVNDSGLTAWNSSALTNLVTQAHAAGDRVVLTVKAFDNPTIYSLTYNSNNASASYASAINAVKARGLDGINIDFEGSTSGEPADFQARFTQWVAGMSQALKSQVPGAQLTLDAYSGSASWDSGFMRIDSLAPYVDAFFIMAYDMTLPAVAPNAPLAGPYTYNDTLSVDQYVQKSGNPAKVILGVPYYGYKFSTVGTTFGSATSSAGATADTYSGVLDDFACASGPPDNLATHWDTPSSTPWAAWYSPATGDPCGGNHGSYRELYYDDATSLGLKYDLVNSRGIRGTGMWAMGYDHGHTELWGAIQSHFMCAGFHVDSLSPGSGVGGQSVVINGCGFRGDGAGGLPSVTFGGVAATAVQLLDPAHLRVTVPAHTPAAVDVTVTNPAAVGGSTASLPRGFIYVASGYTMDAYGGVHALGAAPAYADSSHAYWPGWKIARAVATCPDGQGGYTLDGYGGVHPFGAVPAVSDSSHAYWSGWDIARGLALTGCSAAGVSGYTLDGYGGIHPFAAGSATAPPAFPVSGYWQGWDIAVGIALCPGGTGGYTLDGWGGLHAFGGAPAVADDGHAYWRFWNIARGLVVTGCSPAAGYTLDGYGGVHRFGAAADVPDSSHAYWPGWDIARGITWVGAFGGGYVLDGYGGAHAFLPGVSGLPGVATSAYWPGWDIARGISAAG